MYKEITVQVLEVIQEEPDYLKLKTDGGAGQAVLYLCGTAPVTAGDFVKVNTTAHSLQLGTGGWDIVTSTNRKQYTASGKGHIMKARYTPFQHSVYAVDDPEHPDHDIFQNSFSLHGIPVLLAELHSMLPVLLGALSAKLPGCKTGVVLSDEASLAAGLSEHMTEWKRCDNIYIVTAGQAFGGTEEAVNTANAVQWLAVKQQVNILIISMGPGTAGTATPFGFSGMAQAEWANMIGALGGSPVWVPRLSFMEKRARHTGISHHTITPLLQFTYARSTLVLPYLEEEKEQRLRMQLEAFESRKHVDVRFQDTDEWFFTWLQWYKNDERTIFSMGIPADKNPEYIKGVLAAPAFIMKKWEEEKHGF